MRLRCASLMPIALAVLLVGCTSNAEKEKLKNIDKPVPPTAEKQEKAEKK